MTKYIETPDGMIYKKSECREFLDRDDLFEESHQKEIAEKIFETTGILVSGMNGGEKNEH